MKKTFLLLTLSVILTSLQAQKQLELTSPNKDIKIAITISDKIYYSVSYNDDELLTKNHLALTLANETLGEKPQLAGQKRNSVDEVLIPIVPLKYSSVKNQYNSLILNFKGNYSVEFRAFDNGIAYRFITNKKNEIEIVNEDFTINFPDIYLAHLQQPNNFKTAYEEPYTHVQTNEWKSSDKMATLPVLIDTKKEYKILISESDLSDYPCLFLKSNDNNGMAATFPKVPLDFG